MTTTISCDVAVVGGGPAGAAFVRTLRDLAPGADVVLVDKATFPRDKVCGDALTHSSCPVVQEIFPELRGRIPSRSHTQRYTLHYPNGRTFSRDDQDLDVIPRAELDALLYEAAVHDDLTVLDGTRVVDVRTDGDRVVGVEATRDGEALSVDAELVIAADGSGSLVRRRTRSASEGAPLSASRQYVRGVPPTDAGLVFVIDPDHSGYFWFFPIVGDDDEWSANVGWFGFRRHHGQPRERLEHFLDHDPIVRAYVGDGRREGPVVAAPLSLAPLHRGRVTPTNPLWGDGYLLLGDAASLIHPFTGEGIAFALRSGRRAAELVARTTDATVIGPTYQRDALGFVRDDYNLPRTALLFSVPSRIPPSLRPAYLASLPTLDLVRKGVKHTVLRARRARQPASATP